MKAIRSNRKITPFGGAVPVLKLIKDFKIPELIRECLGTRVKQAKFGYDDAIISWMLTNLCGGRRLDHMRKTKKALDLIPDLNIPSPVTLGRLMKTLATELTTTRNISKGGKKARIIFSEINDNDILTDLLLKATKQVGVLKENVSYVMDIDAVFIETDNFEAKYNRLHDAYGFYPMVALIDDLPVFIEMRNGNVAPAYGQVAFMEKCLKKLQEHNITVDRVRADTASYSKELLEFLDGEGIEFCVNTKMPKAKLKKGSDELEDVQPIIHQSVNKCKNYREATIETANAFWDCEVGDVNFNMYESPNTFRLVIARFPKDYSNPNKDRIERLRDKHIVKGFKFKNGPRGWKAVGNYWHKVIITNDKLTPAEDIIKEYLQRGDSERKFDFLKNGCAWNLPPFSSLTHNTVFLFISALTNNIYRGILDVLEKDIDEVDRKTRLETFTFIFIAVACELIEDTYVFYNTDIAYEKIC